MKIPVTLLDSYRYWKETEFHDQEREIKAGQEIIDKLRGRKTPKTEAMLRGIAFAEILDNPEAHFDRASGNYHYDGFEFDSRSFAEFQLLIPQDAMREVWLPHYHLDGGHYLVGRVDAMKGATIGDAKLITKSFNAAKYESYEDSIQWQAYLLMGDCEQFEYYIAHGKESRKDDVISMDKPQKLTFYRSSSTDERVIQLARDFAAFAEPYL